MLGDAVEVTEGYRTLVVVHPPLHRHARLRLRLRVRPAARAVGVPALRGAGRRLRAPLPRAAVGAGGSLPPEELGRIVGCDLADPGFWDGGLAIIEERLTEAEAAADASGRLA